MALLPTYTVSNPTTVEGGVLLFTITRSTNTAIQSTVYLDTVSGTATESPDFANNDLQPLSFAVGETSKSFNVQTYVDEFNEGSETMSLLLYQGYGGALLATGFGTINDPNYGYTITGASSMNEGTTNNLTVHVNGAPEGSIVSYQINQILTIRLPNEAWYGTVVLDANGNGTIPFSVIANNTTDGAARAEILLNSLNIGSNTYYQQNGFTGSSFFVDVNDSSTTPSSVFTLSSPSTSIQANTDLLLNLHVTNLAQYWLKAGDTVYATLSGVDPSLLPTGLSETGAVIFVLDGSGNATQTIHIGNGVVSQGQNLTVILDHFSYTPYNPYVGQQNFPLTYQLSWAPQVVNNITLPVSASITVDVVAPTVSAFSPADGATGVGVGSNIVFTFSETIQRGAGNIYLRSGSASGSIVEQFDAATSSHLTISGSTLTIYPTSNLSADTQYFVTFGSGVVTDLAGNAYAGTSTYDFRTAATSTPPVTGANLGMPSTGYFNPTGDNLVDATTNGYKWILGSNKTLDFALANGFNGEYWNDIGLVSEYMKLAVEQFSNFADVKFNFSGNYANPTAAYNGGSEITLSVDGVNKLFSSSNTYAMGFFPNSGYNSIYQGAPGDLYLNLNSPANTLPSYLPGSEGWFVLIHELGHTLGLKHPHDDGGTGRPTYSSLGLGGLGIDLMTIMSYKDDASLNLIGWDPATPMILDVYALQYIYGKNTTINAGDTTFNLLADGFYKTLWDPSGSDTLDASSNTSGWTIELPNISLSTLVDTKAGYAAPTLDLNLTTPHSLTWLAGDYENVIGTNYGDVISGNLFDNTIRAGGGNDQIDGGDGFDVCLFKGASTQYVISASSGIIRDTVANRDGTDTLVNIERLQFSDTMVGLDVGKGENTGEVYRLYLTVLGRNPQADAVGCGFWIDKLDKGILTAEQMVGNFLNSSEFVSRFGATTSSNESFVNLMYQNLLGRDGHPDSGFGFWLNVLNNHQASREQVVVGFMESPENVANAAPLIGNTPTYEQWVG